MAFLEALTYFFNNKEWFDKKYNSNSVNTVAFVRDENPSDDLEKIANLFEKGHLTKEEFEDKKTILLKKIV